MISCDGGYLERTVKGLRADPTVVRVISCDGGYLERTVKGLRADATVAKVMSRGIEELEYRIQCTCQCSVFIGVYGIVW